MASHWNVSLTWKIFVGCVVAVLCRLMLDGWVHYWYDSAGQVRPPRPQSLVLGAGSSRYIAVRLSGTHPPPPLCGLMTVQHSNRNVALRRNVGVGPLCFRNGATLPLHTRLALNALTHGHALPQSPPHGGAS